LPFLNKENQEGTPTSEEAAQLTMKQLAQMPINHKPYLNQLAKGFTENLSAKPIQLSLSNILPSSFARTLVT
jgi:hypothetical protein